jgi:hypothetical protein
VKQIATFKLKGGALRFFDKTGQPLLLYRPYEVCTVHSRCEKCESKGDTHDLREHTCRICGAVWQGGANPICKAHGLCVKCQVVLDQPEKFVVPAKEGVLDGSWKLTSWIHEKELKAADFNLTATFAGGIVRGKAANSQYEAMFSAEPDKTLSLLILKLRQWAGQGQQAEAGTLYRKALQDAVSYKLENKTLTLLGADGKELLTFSRPGRITDPTK